MASSVHQLFLLAFLAFLTFAAPRADARDGRLFFSKTARPEVVEPNEATTVPETANPNSATFPGPDRNNRGYGLYGRPEERYSQTYYRGGVHHNTEKLTTANNVPARGNVEPFVDNGSGRGRPLSYGGMRERDRQFGVSDTRFYQDGRYYYDVNTDKYGYGYESNPVRTAPEEYDHGGAGARRGRYENADHEYAKGNKFNGGVENQNQEYIP